MSRPYPATTVAAAAAARMADPTGGIPQQLLPFLHLVCGVRYPLVSMMSTESVVDNLVVAPRLVREHTVHWTFLNAPVDGTVMLVWQNRPEFPCDGYVWADREMYGTVEMKGFTVEMWAHRTGFQPGAEQLATHGRRRYRIVASKTTPNAPVDPALWLVHYSRAPPTDHLPATRIPVDPPVHGLMQMHRLLQAQVQLARKEFLLHDRNSWPAITLPPQLAQQPFLAAAAAQGGMYPNPMMRQTVAPGFYPPGAARPARPQRASVAGANVPVCDFMLEEEDTTSGDFLDSITPRDISRMRYKYNHEWMEEIFSSPYRADQIVPVDLGLGRKGELLALTTPFFNAPDGSSATNADSTGSDKPPYIGRLPPGRADEFSAAATRKIDATKAELVRLQVRHERRLGRFRHLDALADAERRLRDAFVDPDDVGPEVWRLEGHANLHPRPAGDVDAPSPTLPMGSSSSAAPIGQEAGATPGAKREKVADVIGTVEAGVGKVFAPVDEVVCVQRGGLQDTPKPAGSGEGGGHLGSVDEYGDVQMGDTAGAMIDQLNETSGGGGNDGGGGESGQQDWVMVSKDGGGAQTNGTASGSGSGAGVGGGGVGGGESGPSAESGSGARSVGSDPNSGTVDTGPGPTTTPSTTAPDTSSSSGPAPTTTTATNTADPSPATTTTALPATTSTTITTTSTITTTAPPSSAPTAAAGPFSLDEHEHEHEQPEPSHFAEAAGLGLGDDTSMYGAHLGGLDHDHDNYNSAFGDAFHAHAAEGGGEGEGAGTGTGTGAGAGAGASVGAGAGMGGLDNNDGPGPTEDGGEGML